MIVFVQRRVLRSAPEKLRNRTSVSANVTQSPPGTRVNRYISRLIEARQTESNTADLHFLTLMYKSSEREHRVGKNTHTHTHISFFKSCVIFSPTKSTQCAFNILSNVRNVHYIM